MRSGAGAAHNTLQIMRIILLFLMLLAPSISSACSCVKVNGNDEEKAKHYLGNAEAVFFGEAIKIRRVKVRDEYFGEMHGEKTTFKVLKSYKGNLEDYVETEIVTECCVCGLAFLEGEKYFLYLFKNENGNYSTSICSRPKKGDDAMKESVIIEKITANKAPKPLR